MRKALLVGESWITHETHIKGVDSFTSSSLVSGADAFLAALGSLDGWAVEHLMAHDVPRRFPLTEEELAAYDVIILSDIGSRSVALHPDTWSRGEPTPDRLGLLKEWVASGGGLAMIGGYLSFQGHRAAAAFHGTPVEDVLPVVIDLTDDCVERPSGVMPKVATSHATIDGVGEEWPLLLGYNRVVARDEATVVCTIDEAPLLVVGSWGRGRTLAWTSDIGPHWCPGSACEWDGFGKLWRASVRWLGGEEVSG